MPTNAGQREVDRLKSEISKLRSELHKKQVDENREKQKKAKKRKRRRRSSIGEEMFKLGALVCAVVLFIVFCIHDGAYDDFLPEGTISYAYPNQSQGSFTARYLAYEKEEEDAPSGSTKVDMTNAYVDAVGTVPEFNAASVSTPVQSVKVGVNSPTESWDKDHAFVVNYTKLMEQEYSDIKWLETNFMGIPEDRYSTIPEYVKKFAQVRNVVGAGFYDTDNDAAFNSNTEVHAAVGPAVLIRDFLSLSGLGETFNNNAAKSSYGFGSDSYADWKIDLMLVASEEDYDSYISGNTDGINVHYVQVKGTTAGGKAHMYPWCLGQTYIQSHWGTETMNTLVLNKNSSGEFTKDTPEYPPAEFVEGDTAKTLYNVWDSARTRSGDAYWFPTLEASAGETQLRLGASVEATRATSTTSSIVETHPGSANAIFTDTYKDWYCVGILVYATGDTWTPQS